MCLASHLSLPERLGAVGTLDDLEAGGAPDDDTTFHAPAVGAVDEALVHAEQVAGEEARLVLAGAGADLEQAVAVVVGVAGQQRHSRSSVSASRRSWMVSSLELSYPASLGVVILGERLRLLLKKRPRSSAKRAIGSRRLCGDDLPVSLWVGMMSGSPSWAVTSAYWALISAMRSYMGQNQRPPEGWAGPVGSIKVAS